MIKVLFVCLGNICRSPMAEAIFRDLVRQEGLSTYIDIDSAGTGDWHVGKQPHEGTRQLLERKQIPYDGIVARQFTKQDLLEFDYILAMDNANFAHIQMMHGPEKQPFLSRLLDLNPNVDNKEVPDPYYTGNFEEVYELLKDSCQLLLERIRKEHHLAHS